MSPPAACVRSSARAARGSSGYSSAARAVGRRRVADASELLLQLAERDEQIGAPSGVGLGLDDARHRRRRLLEPPVGALELGQIGERHAIAVGRGRRQRRLPEALANRIDAVFDAIRGCVS